MGLVAGNITGNNVFACAVTQRRNMIVFNSIHVHFRLHTNIDFSGTIQEYIPYYRYK